MTLKWKTPKQFLILHRRRKITLMIVKLSSMLPQEGAVKMKLTKKIYKEPKLETAIEIEKQAVEDEKKLSKVN